MRTNGKHANPELRTRWFRKARFGMFIHWNLFALTGQGGWEWRRGWWDRAEWEAAAKKFKPKNFDASAWAQLAKEAGMKYAVLTTMSHDGFAIFDSPVSDFTSVKIGAKRDFVREYVEAFRQAGLKVGLYYSLCDWRWEADRIGPKKDPEAWDEYIKYIHENVKTLCSNYGKIDILWYDGWHRGPEELQAKRLNAMVRKLQPKILINNRAKIPADFGTPEGSIGKYQKGRLWETCTCMNAHWPYVRGDIQWRTTAQTFALLTGCAANGGNLLLNVGPDSDGVIPNGCVNQLREVGKWLQTYGEAIYGTDYCPLSECPFTPMTMKGNKVYLLIRHWSYNGSWHVMDFPHQKSFKGIESLSVMPKEKKRRESPKLIKRAYLLPEHRKVSVSWKGSGILLTDLPKSPPHPHVSVVVLELEDKLNPNSSEKPKRNK